jgi:hypothetical protein
VVLEHRDRGIADDRGKADAFMSVYAGVSRYRLEASERGMKGDEGPG